MNASQVAARAGASRPTAAILDRIEGLRRNWFLQSLQTGAEFGPAARRRPGRPGPGLSAAAPACCSSWAAAWLRPGSSSRADDIFWLVQEEVAADCSRARPG